MKDFLKRIKADFMLTSILCIILGIAFIVFRRDVIDLIGTILSILLVVIGALYLVGYFLGSAKNWVEVLMGIIILAVGIWFLIRPAVIATLIPVAIGVLLLFHGLRALKETLDSRKNNFSPWKINLVLAIISIVFGLLCIFDAFGMMEKAIIVVGIILIYNGISNVWIAGGASYAARRAAKKAEPIDVEFEDDGRGSDEDDGV